MKYQEYKTHEPLRCDNVVSYITLFLLKIIDNFGYMLIIAQTSNKKKTFKLRWMLAQNPKTAEALMDTFYHYFNAMKRLLMT